MRKLLCAFCFCTFGLNHSLQSQPLPLETVLWNGKATPFYQDSAPEGSTSALLQRRKYAERFAALVQTNFRLRVNVGVGFRSCGGPNAYMAPSEQVIVLCNEITEEIAQFMKSRPELFGDMPAGQRLQWLENCLAFVLLHEIGHLMVHINGAAITGREEDVADQFAVWYALHLERQTGNSFYFPGIWYFLELTKREDRASTYAHLANEHSLNGQRVFNMACWAYGGSISQLGSVVAGFTQLPDERKARCNQEFAVMDQGMRKGFNRFLKNHP